jgi:hypothetical protein
MERIRFLSLVIVTFLLSCEGVEPDGLHHFVYFDNQTNQPLYIGSWWHGQKDCIPAHSADSVLKIGIIPSTSCLGNLLYKGAHGYEWDEEHRIIVCDVENWGEQYADFVFILSHTLMDMSISLTDLQRLNWRLTFPPTENMKDLTMTPSYEEIISKYGAGD